MMLAATVCHSGQVYKCTDAKGRAVFSQVECGGDAQIVQVEPQDRSMPRGAAIKRQNEIAKALDKSTAQNTQQRLQERLRYLNRNRESLAKQHKRKVDRLQNRLSNAEHLRNQEEIRERISALNTQFSADNQRLNEKVSAIQRKLSTCCRGIRHY